MQRMDTNYSMNKITQRGLLFALTFIFVLSCGKKSESADQKESTQKVISETVGLDEFQQKLNAAENPILLDVRTPAEVADGYIEGATNIDFNAADFQSKIESLDKDATYFVYCAVGGRSRKTADLMKDLQFKAVYDLAGGFDGWRKKGLPIAQPAN